MDHWGPYRVARVANVTGAHISLTKVDDFTRATRTQLLKNKTQVASVVKYFFAIVKTQFNTKITLVRLDNGTEFINLACTDFSLQNVLFTRDLLETARALRFQVGLPKYFLGECVPVSYTHLTLPTKRIV